MSTPQRVITELLFRYLPAEGERLDDFRIATLTGGMFTTAQIAGATRRLRMRRDPLLVWDHSKKGNIVCDGIIKKGMGMKESKCFVRDGVEKPGTILTLAQAQAHHKAKYEAIRKQERKSADANQFN